MSVGIETYKIGRGGVDERCSGKEQWPGIGQRGRRIGMP